MAESPVPIQAGSTTTCHNDAEPMLLIPGTMCDQRLWQAMLHTPAGQQLQQQFAISHAAIWQQPDLDAMQATIRMAQASHHIGFSMGGYLAMTQAVASSHPLQSLVVIAANAGALSAAELQARQQALQWLSSHRYQGMSRQRLAEFIHPTQRANPKVTDVVLAMDRELGHAVLQTQLQHTSQRRSLLSELSQIDCPVLIIGGAADQLVSPSQLATMAALIPNAELVLLPDCGHMLPLEQPAKLASVLLAFYQRLSDIGARLAP